MGLSVSIYKDGGKSFSNGGVSTFMDEGVIVNIDGPSSDPDNVHRAALMLVPGAYGTARVVPAVPTPDGGWTEERRLRSVGPMMGGCYVATSDSRFTEAVEKITGTKFYGAVPLHDRFETTAEYAAMSA
jgi:hypothetical protein